MSTVQEAQPIAACTELFRLLFAPGDWVEFRCHRAAGGAIHKAWIQAGADMSDVSARLDAWNGEGFSIYFGANPRKESGGSKAVDVQLARCHFVDIECTTWDDIRSSITDTLPMPTAVVNSGSGVHLWWRLPEPIADLTHWQAQQKALIARVETALGKLVLPAGCKVDGGIHDAPRIMRAPGWINRKPGRGQTVGLVFTGEPVDVWPLLGSTAAVKQRSSAGVADTLPPARFARQVCSGWWDVKAGRRETIYKAAGCFARCGTPLEQAQADLTAAAYLMHDAATPQLAQHDIIDISRQVANAYKFVADQSGIEPVPALSFRMQRAGMKKATEAAVADIGAFIGLERIGLDVPCMPVLTYKLFGLRGLIMCGGMPGCGKTVLTMQAALDAVRNSADVCAVLVSCEMTRAEIITRWLSTLAGCTDREVMTSQAPGIRKRIEQASQDLQAVSVTASGAQRVFIFEPADIGRMHGSDGAALVELIEAAKAESGCSRCVTVCDPFQGLPFICEGKGELDRDRELMAYLLAANRATGEHDPLVVVTETVKSSWRDVPTMSDILGSGRLGYSGDVVIAMRQVAVAEGTLLHDALTNEIAGDPKNYRLVQVRIVKGRRCTQRGNVWFVMDTLRSSMQEARLQDELNQTHNACEEEMERASASKARKK